jgi:hypothetical protein
MLSALHQYDRAGENQADGNWPKGTQQKFERR